MKRIDVLPDDVLLGIFDFYVDTSPSCEVKTRVEAWQLLVHVCRRWRGLILDSPRRLNLRLFCTSDTPARDTLDIWPALPLIVHADQTGFSGMDNTIVALRQSHRVREVDLFLGWQMENVLAGMQVPFPELTDLTVVSFRKPPPVIPDSFLGGSAPRLRHFELTNVPFPELPKLHLSAPHLVRLTISHTHPWYVSSEAMAALLSGLSSLDTLSLDLPQSGHHQETRRLPPSKRSVIPALTFFEFEGDIKYLENLVTFIDSPRLNSFITLFDRIDVDTPKLTQFINCAPTLRALDEAHVQFGYGTASIVYRTSKSGFDNLRIGIICLQPDWQLSSFEQICNSLHPLPTAEDLYIEHEELLTSSWDNSTIESTLWLELLLQFTAVKNLYLSKEFVPDIAGALQELVGGRVMEVLPSLQNIFMEGLEPAGPLQEDIGHFVAARQLSGHPIAISVWVSAVAEDRCAG